jgi:hypothetical protein
MTYQTFQRYIDDGWHVIRSHPDYDQRGLIDAETAAVDMIASTLHAIYGTRPLGTIDDDAQAMLDRAFRSFCGDYEDLEVRA